MIRRSVKIVLGLTLVLFLASTYLLVRRFSDQELWGYLPLLQLTSLWVLIVAVFNRKPLADAEFRKKVGLATISAVLFAVGFPPSPMPIFLFVAFVPLLLALHQKEDDDQWRNRLFLLFHTFVLWNVFSTYWVANSAYLAGFFANATNAFLMCLPILGYLFVRRSLGKGVAFVAFISCWLTFEFLHLRWELQWPWLTLGNGLAKVPFAIQWYSYTGALGGSLWILATNYLVYEALQMEEIPRWRAFMLPIAFLMVPLFVSVPMYLMHEEKGDVIEIVSVQPNFEPHFEKFMVPQQAVAQRCLRLAESVMTEETDLVILPETSLSSINLDRPFGNEAMMQFRSFCERRNVHLITGLAAYRLLESEEEIALPTTREIKGQGESFFVEQYNCAVQIDPTGKIDEYYKAKYVPGAEYFPFHRILFFMKPLMDKLGGTVHGYRIRTGTNVFTSEAGAVAPAICYESVFGEFMTRFVKRGADVLLVMTNDGWWDNTAGYRQHADFARIRAIESRRSVVRSANMGTCCLINQRGDISGETRYGIEDAINVRVHKNEALTFYVKWGDVLGRVSLFMTLLLLARSLVNKFKK